jgi:putative endonuclease
MAQRLANHNAGRTPSTKAYVPWVVVYEEETEDVSAARKREVYLKSLKSRIALERLIKGGM